MRAQGTPVIFSGEQFTRKWREVGHDVQERPRDLSCALAAVGCSGNLGDLVFLKYSIFMSDRLLFCSDCEQIN